MMFPKMLMLFITTLLLLCSSSSSSSSPAQSTHRPSLSPSPSPSPSPPPPPANISDVLALAGPFHSFLKYISSTTDVIRTFQNQANTTGITIFVPIDSAFSSQITSSLSNLTQPQLKNLLLFHALPRFYDLADFSTLTQTPTFAGGDYALNFSDNAGTVHLSSGWSNTMITSAVYAADPVAIYQIDQVLLPEAIFGTDIPPVPAPGMAPDAESPVAEGSGSGKSSSSSSSSEISSRDMSCSFRIRRGFGNWGDSVLAVFGVVVVGFL